ncbi:hypothetical protein Goarm_008107 [Gossypium armourianum]|uniref:Uncharacterized protein n=1 Tax=Gossypium armourianum TaxID=34283 RepID=A0A7J9JNU8_9ROSI|nr:hypothetical protein [Gossypium armourianum]
MADLLIKSTSTVLIGLKMQCVFWTEKHLKT